MIAEIIEICPTTTRKWIQQGALFVDVREKNEVEEVAFKVDNLLNIPLSEFENRFREIPKNTSIVMVCRTGDRSLRATNYLLNAGYNNKRVVNMKHGLAHWIQKGFGTNGELETGKTQNGSVI